MEHQAQQRQYVLFYHDADVYDNAQDQLDRHLLSEAVTKDNIHKIFGKGRWRGIRRRGIWQNGKVRGIDNARSSRTNLAAWLQDTIMITPHDIAIQIIWCFSIASRLNNDLPLKVLCGWASPLTTW